jgi:O26-antigen biosynthesis N-acetyl-L-fucosamine transferase
MRLLLIVDCYLPDRKSAAMLMHDLAEEFDRRGHIVTILAPSPDLETNYTVETCGRLTVGRYRTGSTKTANLRRRAINEMLLSVSCWRGAQALIQQYYDLAIFYSPSIFFGPLVAYLKYRRKLKTYLILRDIFPDWALQAGVLKPGVAYRVFKLFEKLQYSVSDHIGVETSGSVSYFQGGPHRHKVDVLRNWTRTDVVVQPGGCSFRQELGLEGKTVFLYGGNVGLAQDMDNIVRLARRMERHENAHFLLIGAGSEVDRLRALLANGGPGNMTLMPALDQDRYISAVSECDVGLISLDRRLRSFSTTGKLLGYLRCGLPVLASVNPGNELMDILHESGAGLCSWNGDDETLYQNAVSLCSPSVRASIADRSRDLLHDKFSVGAAAERILRVTAGATP